MKLGQRIKALRQQKGWSLRELSRQARVRQATISEIESGKRQDMTTETAKRIAIALGVGVDFLIGTWDTAPSQPRLTPQPLAPRRPGAWKGRVWIADDFDNEDPALTRLFEEGEIFPDAAP